MKPCARNFFLMAIAVVMGLSTRYIDAHPAVILAVGAFLCVLLALLVDVE
ncbi:hypothetical protein [Cupriavidus pauculus]|nr:hypothetical protein [Cupriavidus pauculus]GJG92858.1 hypothetical protein CBA19C6_00235 [Cupriavidus pauculus]